MTAFGRAGCALAEWEIKSVNHRFLDLTIRLPEALRSIETPLRQLTQKHVQRGKVDAALRIPGGQGPAQRLNAAALRRVLDAVADIREHAADAPLGAIDPLDLMRQPGVFEEDGQDLERLKDAALATYADALDDLVAQRRSEGAAIATLLRERLQQADALADEAGATAERHATVVKARLERRLAELAGDAAKPLPAERLAQEVALLAQKADVAEELDRLRMHVAEARRSLDGDAPCGRRLEFIAQELNREANTLAAKALLPETARHAVALKVVVEQLREQAQNVE